MISHSENFGGLKLTNTTHFLANSLFINIHIVPHHKQTRLCGLKLCVGTKQDVDNK